MSASTAQGKPPGKPPGSSKFYKLIYDSELKDAGWDKIRRSVTAQQLSKLQRTVSINRSRFSEMITNANLDAKQWANFLSRERQKKN